MGDGRRASVAVPDRVTDAVIRPARLADLAAIVDYLDDHWRRDHVFVRRPELLAWQHTFGEGDLSFLLAEADGQLEGLFGFIPHEARSPGGAPAAVVGGAIWHVRDTRRFPRLGLRLFRSLVDVNDAAAYFTVGTSPVADEIYRGLGLDTGTMSHVVLLGRGIDRDGIALVPADLTIPAPPPDPLVTVERLGFPEALRRLDPIIERHNRLTWPSKSVTYVARRFVEHPNYRYHVLVLAAGGGADRLALVCRDVTVAGLRATRVVDAYGPLDLLNRGAGALQRLLDGDGIEYLDLMWFAAVDQGLDPDLFLSADAVPGLILPDHFEPFERENGALGAAVWVRRPLLGDYRVLRADVDQDRPNQ